MTGAGDDIGVGFGGATSDDDVGIGAGFDGGFGGATDDDAELVPDAGPPTPDGDAVESILAALLGWSSGFPELSLGFSLGVASCACGASGSDLFPPPFPGLAFGAVTQPHRGSCSI